MYVHFHISYGVQSVLCPLLGYLVFMFRESAPVMREFVLCTSGSASNIFKLKINF